MRGWNLLETLPFLRLFFLMSLRVTQSSKRQKHWPWCYRQANEKWKESKRPTYDCKVQAASSCANSGLLFSHCPRLFLWTRLPHVHCGNGFLCLDRLGLIPAWDRLSVRLGNPPSLTGHWKEMKAGQEATISIASTKTNKEGQQQEPTGKLSKTQQKGSATCYFCVLPHSFNIPEIPLPSASVPRSLSHVIRSFFPHLLPRRP